MLKYFKKLSLIKQLLAVFGICGIILFFVVVPLIDYNLSSIIDKQMYDKLSVAQDMVINGSYMPMNRPGEHTYHIIYDYESHSFVKTNILDERRIYEFYSMLFEDDLVSLFNGDSQIISNKDMIFRETYYFMLNRYEDNRCLISIVSSDYSDDLLNSLRNQIVYTLYLFLVIFSIIMLIWVLTVIRPLRRIKVYIDDFKENRVSHLSIDREDEIGIVFHALEDMKENIEKQEKQKEEMIHNISHDLKTPIALIKSYGQSVKDDIYPYGDKESSMDVILENAERLEKKVKSLLLLNRLDYLNTENHELNELDMRNLIERIILQIDCLNPHIELKSELEDSIFVGEEEHWRIVIENIVENANRYAKSKIMIIVRNHYMEIYNDGSYIDEESILDLFDPYVKGVKGQFGLGLSIVKKICDMYDYDVFAQNKDEGVSFVIQKRG